ncbi:MAG: lipoyl synthase, partial [Halanaerobium sp.]|nr:lipoyl synthase [Halanaerobium sp.]
TSDFQMKRDALERIASARPDIFNHNLETVPRLYSLVRPQADYKRSLAVLEYMKEFIPAVYTKSGIMVGLGETEDEVIQVMEDLQQVYCDILTIGQYLQPSKEHLPVARFISQGKFRYYEEMAKARGFTLVAAGPFVRSSFNAGELTEKLFE